MKTRKFNSQTIQDLNLIHTAFYIVTIPNKIGSNHLKQSEPHVLHTHTHTHAQTQRH